MLTSYNTTPRVVTLLSTLHIPALERTNRLQADLARLSPDAPLDSDLGGERPRLSEFLKHIEHEVEKRPHLLVAYTWNMYMALFSGGRYLRAQLRDANAASWKIYNSDPNLDGGESATTEENVDAPLQFWNFAGDEDGEDLKADFKARVSRLEEILTVEERAEIVAEGAEIMKGLIQIVRELEEMEVGGVAEPPNERSLYSRLLDAPTAVASMITSLSWGIAGRFGRGPCPADVVAELVA